MLEQALVEGVARVLRQCEARGLRDIAQVRSALRAEFSNYTGLAETFDTGERPRGWDGITADDDGHADRQGHVDEAR